MGTKRKAARRARGSGTIQRQRDGSYIARTADQSRSGRFPAGQDGYRAAEEALDTWNAQIGAGADPNQGRQKLRDFARLWLADVVQPACRPRTLEFYTRHVGYATAYLGDTPLEAVSTQALERMLGKIAADGLSPRSVEHVRAVLRNLFNVAKRWHLVTENPAAAVPARLIPDAPDRVLSPAQVAILLDAVRDHRHEALFHIALSLGLRRGELLGLRWKDVDWDAGLLTVAQQVTEGKGRRFAITPYVKSSDGRRVLPLTRDLLAQLRTRQALDTAEGRTFQQRAADKAERQGEPTPLIQWNAAGLVFCSEVGTFVSPRNLYRVLGAIVARTNARLGAQTLPADLAPHDLRRTALTDLAASGEAKAVQSIAGHASISTTMELYARRRITAMRAAVEAMERNRKTG